MERPATPLDRSISEEQVLLVIRQLLDEMGAEVSPAAVTSTAQLETDLGMRSLERAELIARLETEFAIQLPDGAGTEANTAAELTRVMVTVVSAQVATEIATESETPEIGSLAESEAAAPTSATNHIVQAKAEAREAHAGTGTAHESLSHRALDILYGLYFCLVFPLWLLPSWVIVLFIRDHRAAGRFTSKALRSLFAMIRIPVHVVGKEYMETPGPKVYACNHTSYFDVVALMMGLGVNYRFIAKSEVHQMPFIGTFLRKMKHLSFVRASRKSRMHQMREMQDVLRQGESVFVFPEGTFTAEEGVRAFQLGAFKASIAVNVPIIPVSLRGTRAFLRDGTYLPRRTRVTITLSPPIYPNVSAIRSGEKSAEWRELIRLRDETRKRIAQYSGEPVLPTGAADK
jgi:acyl carrier protein